MEYDHTQEGYLHWILLLLAGVLFVAVPFASQLGTRVVLASTSAALVFAALMFAWLRVRDEGDCLVLRYGPLPLFRKRFRFADITALETGRSSLVDGWGIHWMPGRGWTYNIWGFRCVKLRLGSKTVRIGTDDPEGLATFLRARLAGK
jgi:hypothetical protein